MVFRNRSRLNSAIRPVHRIKHVVDAQGGIVLDNLAETRVIEAVDAPVVTSTRQVETGSTINGIFLKVEVYATTAGALSNAYLAVFKNPGDNLTFPKPNVIGSDDNKKYVIHQEMVMLERSVNGNPRTLFSGVIAIPRGYRRFGINDTLRVSVFSPGVNLDFCIQCIFKEFR